MNLQPSICICGTIPSVDQTTETCGHGATERIYFVRCPGCGLRGPNVSDYNNIKARENSIDKWNECIPVQTPGEIDPTDILKYLDDNTELDIYDVQKSKTSYQFLKWLVSTPK